MNTAHSTQHTAQHTTAHHSTAQHSITASQHHGITASQQWAEIKYNLEAHQQTKIKY